MPWTVEYNAAEGIVQLIAKGAVFNDDARAQAAEVIGLVKKHNADFVLADYSEVKLEVSLANLYWLPEYYTELGAPQHIRAALVLPPQSAELEAYQFFQVACKNAGYNVKLFDSTSSALGWLHQFRPDIPYTPPPASKASAIA
jgi:hypothetical protein